VVALCLLLSGCKSWQKVVEVPVYVHDTSYIAKEVHDSTYIDRWHTVYQKGDTVFVTETEIKYRERVMVDTAYKYVEKPVEVTVTETVEVEKPLSWWQKTFIGLGVMSLLALIGIVVWKTKKWWIKLFIK
jgi:hypothetical protein